MPSFNLQHLKYFYDALRLGGVSQAALENHVSQSAVSQGIAKLEVCLGHPLLMHRKNCLQLTEEGRKVFDQAGLVLKAAESLEDSIQMTEGAYCGQVVVGCTQSLARSLLLDVICHFHNEAPKVKLKLSFGHTALVKQRLMEGSIDFGLALDNEDLSAFETTQLYQGQFAVFQDAQVPRLDRLQTCIFTEPRPEVHALKKAYQAKFGTELGTLMEISSWEMISSLVSGSSMVGFFPDYLTLDPAKKGLLRACALELPEIPYQIFLVRHKKVPLSRSGGLFFEMVRAYFAKQDQDQLKG
jgi:DNA-binding transcriptional LysR family regulator